MTAARLLVALVALSLAASCAPRTPPAVAPGAPHYPDFVFPAPAAGAPENLAAQHEAAWRVLQAGDVKAAQRGFSTITKQAPTFYAADAALGYAALARKDYAAAIAQFDRAIAADARYAPALAGRGQTYLAMNEHARALESFDAALAADPSLASIRNTADVLRLQVMQGGVGAARKAAAEGRLQEARTSYEQAILASPQSPFLFRELALVELRDNRLPAAVVHAQKAVELDPADAKNQVALADVLEAQGDLARTLDALRAAAALEPNDTIDQRIEALRAKGAFSAMPEGYRTIDATATITRAQLAALIGVQLEDLVKQAPPRGVAVMTDVRGHWASEWILAVTRAGFMDVFPNHTFQPDAAMRRADLASAASRILNVIAIRNPQLAAQLRNARRKFTDLPPGHLNYRSASVAVEAGVLAQFEDGSFQLARPVTGAEALAAVRRLQELAGTGR